MFKFKPIVATTVIVMVAVLAAVIIGNFDPVHHGSGVLIHAAHLSGVFHD